MKTKSKWYIVAGLVVFAGAFVAFGLNRSAQPQHFTAKAERGDIHDVVEATGTINAVITVQVGSQVSGTIAKLNVDFNSRVHKGDVVALIDPALFQGALLQSSADHSGGAMGPRKLTKILAPLVVIVFGLSLTVSMYSQVTGATLSRTISDPSGVVIPGAQISIRNTATGISRVSGGFRRLQYGSEPGTGDL